jgi:(1->4)-alpha-D-glucan 1-alpha-D-glucosylmutase
MESDAGDLAETIWGAKENVSGHIALEPVWVLKEDSSPLEIPLYIMDTCKSHPLQCRLQTEDQRIQEWDCTASALPLTQENPQFPGFDHYMLPLPDPLEVGYHSILVKDKQTGEYDETLLIIVPTQCYQPPAIQAPESRRWGLSVVLPNIASSKNWGVGDLSDLNRIIDWCSAHGADFIQLNDSILDQPSSWNFLDIEAIEDFSECHEARKLFWDPAFQIELKKLRETVSASEQFVMSVMTRQKLEILHLLYRNFTRNHLKKNSFRAYSYRTFVERHGKRLEHFALYQALQEYFEREDPSIQGWQNWPEAYHHPQSPAVQDFAQANSERLGFYQYLQWQLDIQMHTAGLRSWEQALGIGLCLNFGWGTQLSPIELWSNPHLFAHHFHINLLQSPQRLDAQETQPVPLIQPLRTDRYQFWIDSIRQPMQHAGALYIQSIDNLFQDFLDDGDGQYVEDLLGILALESHRQHCMVIGGDFSSSLPPQNEKMLLQWRIFPAQAIQLPLPSSTADQPEWRTREKTEALISLRTKNQPSLAHFWEGRDIIQLTGGAQSELLKEQRDKQITQRTLQRISILQQLEAQGLLPDGLTPDPLTAPLMTPELCAAVHELVAREPAQLFAVQLEDLLPSFDKSHVETGATEELNRVPVPVEIWGTDAKLLAVAHAISQIRPSSKQQIITREITVLEPDQRVSLLTPRAIYRLQFNQHFTFRDATNLVPYLNRLGISHCYASPLLKARSGSPHGYDITDHQQFNQDIGSIEEFQAFSDKLRMHGMGLILDIVPNHMGAGKDNPWWIDVLENGPASLYADYFDIDWHPLSDDLQNKILLAILGDSYGKILENGDIQLRFEAETGRFWLHYWEHQVPVDPATYPIILGHRLEVLETRLGHNDSALLEYRSLLSAFENLPAFNKEERARERTIALNRLISLYQQTPEMLQFIEENAQDFQSKKEHPTSLSRLNRLLEKQNYRLANWRVASDEINDLIAVRVEDERVFRDTHELIMSLIEQRLVQGLRIDHPDGLYAPAQYFHRLQTEAARRLGISEQGFWHLGSPELPFYILIEKVLARFERLPEDWAVQGTTGYEFANTVNGLFVCQDNEKEFTRLYEKFIGHKVDFDALCYESKKLIMKTALNSELGVLTYQLHRLSKAHWCYQDFTLHNLRSALIEVVACFPVYRTYVTEQNISQKDREYIEWAIRSAKRKNLSTDESVFDFLHAVLVTDVELTREADDFKNAVVHFAMKFQQYSSPVMAKGVEDTAFYRYNRLVSLNEVGGDPKQFGHSVAHFHYQNLDRAKQTPHTLLATSTHDTKRSEDVRAKCSMGLKGDSSWM